MSLPETESGPQPAELTSKSSSEDGLARDFSGIKLSLECHGDSDGSNSACFTDGGGGKGKADDEERRLCYPLRLGEPDCVFYLRNGTCRFGAKCKFNHPSRKRKIIKTKFAQKGDSDQPEENGTESQLENLELEDCEIREAGKKKEKEDASQAGFLTECKYFSRPGGCKYGKACRYIHPEGKDVQSVDLNFLGLPLRPGERECTYFMRTGNCKFSVNCRFHHPVGECDAASKYPVGEHPRYVASGTSHLQVHAAPGASPLLALSWSEQRAHPEPVPYRNVAPPAYNAGIIPHQGVHQCLEWQKYQFHHYNPVAVNPFFPPEFHVQNFAAMPVNQPMYPSENIMHLPLSDDYPERPGHPECQHFVKNGYCKYKKACKYHHPKPPFLPPFSGALTPLGLPLNPGQPICTYYGRFGVCKYGPACKFNHPFSVSYPALPVGLVPAHFSSPQ